MFGNHFKIRSIQYAMAVLYHNPRCSKSRQALTMCQDSKIAVEIHPYLDEPLSYATLLSLLERLDGESKMAIRFKDKKFKLAESAELDVEDNSSIALFLSKNGHLMERPWLDVGTATAIGRPVENLLRYL